MDETRFSKAIKNKTNDYYVQHDKKELSHDASVRQSKSHRYLIPESSVAKYCSPNELCAPSIHPEQQPW